GVYAALHEAKHEDLHKYFESHRGASMGAVKRKAPDSGAFIPINESANPAPAKPPRQPWPSGQITCASAFLTWAPTSCECCIIPVSSKRTRSYMNIGTPSVRSISI